MDGKKSESLPGVRVIWELACRRLKKEMPEETARGWIDRLEIQAAEDGRIVLRYLGKEDLKNFGEENRALLKEAVSWAAKREIEVEIRPALPDGEKPEGARASGRAGEKRIRRPAVLGIAAIAAAVLVFAVLIRMDHRAFEEVFYQVSSEKAGEALRIIQLSDLKGEELGGENAELIRRVKLLEPDLIAMTGDMTGEGRAGEDQIISLCQSLTETAPVYYIYGDSESDRFLDASDGLKAKLESAGVQVLWNETGTFEKNGVSVDVYGALGTAAADLGGNYRQFLEENPQRFKLMLCHEPYLLSELDARPDLVLSGHTLGGGIRLPYLGAVYDKEYGLFPERDPQAWISGLYAEGDSSLIVSAGLAESGVLRVHNRPELVIVDVKPY